MLRNLPIPKFGHEILGEGISDTLKNLMMRRLKEQELAGTEAYRQAELEQTGPLRSAQATAAKAKSERDQMLANLLSGTKGTPQGDGMSIHQALLTSGALNLPTHVVEGQVITPFGSYKVGETPTEKRTGETQAAVSKDVLKSTAEASMGALPINASFKTLDQLMEMPNYDRIAGTAEGKLINSQFLGLPTGAMLQRAFPKKFTSSDAQLAGMVEAHFGNIITGVAAKFKGPFKDMVRGIINNMKPNMGDSKAVQQGKISALKQLSDLADQYNEKIATYTTQGMDPTLATIKVSREVPIEEDLSKLMSNLGKSEKPSKETEVSKKSPTSKIVKPVRIIAPDNKTIIKFSDEKNAQKFLSSEEGKGHKRI